MIDSLLITTAVNILSTYLTKSGDKFAEKFGEKMFDKTGKFYEALKEKFKGDDYAGLTLLRLHEDPQSDSKQSSLVNVIKEKVKEDSTFESFLNSLIKEISESSLSSTTSLSEGSIQITGNVISSEVIAGNNNKIDKKLK